MVVYCVNSSFKFLNTIQHKIKKFIWRIISFNELYAYACLCAHVRTRLNSTNPETKELAEQENRSV